MFGLYLSMVISVMGQIPMEQVIGRSCLVLDDLASPRSIQLSNDGRRLIVGGGTPIGGDWKILDLKKGSWLLTGQQRCGIPWIVQMSATGTFVATGGNFNCLYLADAKTGKTIWNLSKEGHVGVIHNIQFTPDDKFLISTDPGDMTIRVWDIKEKNAYSSFRFANPQMNLGWRQSDYIETAKRVFHVDVSPDLSTVSEEYAGIDGSTLTPNGKMMALAGNTKGKVRFLDLATGKIERTIQLKQGRASRLHFTADGKWLIAGTYYKTAKEEGRGRIEIWDLDKNKFVVSMGEHESGIIRIALSPDKKTILSGGSGDGFRVWDVATGKQKYSYFTKEDPRLPRVKISPDMPEKPFVESGTRAAGCAFLPGGETFIIVPSWSLWNTEIYFYDSGTGKPIDHRDAYKRIPVTK